jgi:hypothetical protein
MWFGQMRLVLHREGKEGGFVYGEQRRRLIIITVSVAGGSTLRSLCFGLTSCTTRKALVIFGRKRHYKRRKRRRNGWIRSIQSSRHSVSLNGSLLYQWEEYELLEIYIERSQSGSEVRRLANLREKQVKEGLISTNTIRRSCKRSFFPLQSSASSLV